MTALARKFGEQLARPQGWAGRLLGRAMDIANRAPMQRAVELLAPQTGERIVDAGCGTGMASLELRRRATCRVIGIDRSPTMIELARRNAERQDFARDLAFHEADLFDPGLACAGYDAVLALNVLYFCDAESRMLQSLRRLLRPGGRLVAYVTDRATMERWPFVRHGTHRLFDRAELIEAFIKAGFDGHAVRIDHCRIARGVTGFLVRAEA